MIRRLGHRALQLGFIVVAWVLMFALAQTVPQRATSALLASFVAGYSGRVFYEWLRGELT